VVGVGVAAGGHQSSQYPNVIVEKLRRLGVRVALEYSNSKMVCVHQNGEIERGNSDVKCREDGKKFHRWKTN